MPVKRGHLKPEDDIKIRKNYTFLMDNFDPTEGTMDEMISLLVFDFDDLDKVKNGGENTRKGRAERFIEILRNADKDAYQSFLKALRNSGCDHVAVKLESTDTSPPAADDPDAWLFNLTEQQKTRQPSDAEASQISDAFGKGWEHLFSELGISKAKIEQMQMAHPHSISVVITNLIIQWRQKNAGDAQFIVLLQATQKVKDRCTIDWNVVEKVAKGLS